MKRAKSDFKPPPGSGPTDAHSSSRLDAKTPLALVGSGTCREYRKKQIVYAQGALAEEVFYLEKGRVIPHLSALRRIPAAAPRSLCCVTVARGSLAAVQRLSQRSASW
jgi:hypothetical protein